jgi:hypothetical protein
MPIFRETPGATFKHGMATALQVPEPSISILNIQPLELRRGGGGVEGAGAGAGAGAIVDVGMWLRVGARETDRARVHVRGVDEGRESEAYSGRHDFAQERGRGMRIEIKVAPLHQDNATLIAARLTRHKFFSITTHATRGHCCWCWLCVPGWLQYV